MKSSKLILAIVFSTASTISTHAQWQGTNPVYYTAGNVGIGTTSPSAKLEVSGGQLRQSGSIANDNSVMFVNSSTTGYGLYSQGGLDSHYVFHFVNQAGTSLLYGQYNRVGIGTLSPVANLQIGESTANGLVNFGGYSFAGSVPSSGDFFAGMNATSLDNNTIKAFQSNGYGFSALQMSYNGEINFYSKGGSVTANEQINIPANNVLKILSNGNVGIGTATPGSFKLAVNGKIWSQEVNVAMTNPGPDYVFEKEYTLLPLAEVENYIKENKHLPEVPSAKEMEKDGLNLKEMNLLLLKKVEELTLHAIAQEKEISELKNEVRNLKK